MELTDKNVAAPDSSLEQSNTFESNLQMLISAVGGNENIVNITHCMTRLRFKLINESLVDKEKIESIKGVKGVVLAQGQTQVVIGVEVEQWYNALSGVNNVSDNSTDIDHEKGKLFQNAMRVVAGIFGPVVPAIAGAGMLMGLLSGLIATNVISETSDTVFF